MKIAFLGKGGSGKSTMATAMVEHLLQDGKTVLAVDADHNMDLSYNLGAEPSVFLGNKPGLIKKFAGLPDSASFKEALEQLKKLGKTFRITPADEFTTQVTSVVKPNLILMVAGPHTDVVRSGEHCSHSLAAPLKVYLPLLELGAGEAVVMDERAGTDPVATGILAGVDLAVIVQEPTVNSTRVATQIAHELELAKVPYITVDNKITDVKEDLFKMIRKVMERMVA